MRNGKNNNKSKMFSDRITWFSYIFSGAMLIFILYLFAVQVLDVRHLRVKAKNQRKLNNVQM